MAGARRSPLEGIASFLDVHVIPSPLNVVVRAHFLFPRVFGVFLELRIKSVCVCVCVNRIEKKDNVFVCVYIYSL